MQGDQRHLAAAERERRVQGRRRGDVSARELLFASDRIAFLGLTFPVGRLVGSPLRGRGRTGFPARLTGACESDLQTVAARADSQVVVYVKRPVLVRRRREGPEMFTPLSQTAEYALRAVIYLAEEAQHAPVRVQRMADALSVPRNYLSKTLFMLARAGVLSSGRGPRGGFRLAAPPEKLTLAEIIAPFQPLAERPRCLLGRPECSALSPCAAHARWQAVSEQIRFFFHETTVADLMRRRPPATNGG
ncbi:MAG: Rrf2 family transcriptional regulator [Gemmatimonadetes bacterium]|nr:Rrf2 family transcriptional regulator [Gemmatimonadota bacterium]